MSINLSKSTEVGLLVSKCVCACVSDNVCLPPAGIDKCQPI